MKRNAFDRRTLLRLFGGIAVAAVPRLSAAARQRITIAGGGIIGANLAYRLAKRGAAVTLVERTRPASGATANSFAWINATYSKQPFMKQKPDGRIVTGLGFSGSPTTDTSRESAERFLKTASQVLPAFAKTEVENVTRGWRPLPQDEFPIVGFSSTRPDVYITVMHSGVTLAPLVAHLAAIEILDGVDAQPLAPYRPARFNT